MNQTATSNTSSNTSTNSAASFSRALTMSATALILLITFQAAAYLPQFGRSSNIASAGQVSQVGGFTIMTSDANTEDILLLLDGRNEQLSVYRNENNNTVQLYQKVSLPRLFSDAKAREQGK